MRTGSVRQTDRQVGSATRTDRQAGSAMRTDRQTGRQALTKDAGFKLDRTGELKNILITGAAGGVGLYAVQLPKLGNTHLTATCGARNIELVKSLGADEVLDYKTPEEIALKSPSGRKYDYVIHSASQAIPWSIFEANLSARGKVIDLIIGASNLFTFVLKKITFSKKKLALLIINPKAENLDCLVKLVKEGKLKTKGELRPLFPGKFPQIPATDVAGDVVEVGQGAKKFKFGDKVVVLLSHFSGGGLAEFAATNERLMVARPPEVSAAEGACLLVAGLTAPQALTQCAGVKVDGTGQNKEHIDHCCLWWRGALCSPTSKAWDTNVTATCGACNIELVKS
ncbi:hypothetical protein ACFX13_036204 [Malus domestica]